MSKRTVSKRTAKFVSALFASLLAGTPLTTVSHGAAGASGECLPGPKGVAPQGSHWFYRIDYATKRHCWYVRGEDRLSQAAPPAPAPSEPANPAPSPKKASAPRLVADAYDALPLPQRAAPATSVTAPPPAAANVASPPTSQPAVATRWPEPSAASASAAPAPAANNPVANPQSAPAVAPPAASAAVPFVAADASSKSQSSSIPMVLTVILGALSVAGVMGSALFSKRSAGRTEMRGAQRVNWNFADTDRAAPTRPRSGARVPTAGFRDLRPADDPNRRIAEMLSRLARSAAT